MKYYVITYRCEDGQRRTVLTRNFDFESAMEVFKKVIEERGQKLVTMDAREIDEIIK